MNEGEIKFCCDGESWGLAFKDEALKKGPLYPAVSLLHCAGCELRSEAMMPKCFR